MDIIKLDVEVGDILAESNTVCASICNCFVKLVYQYIYMKSQSRVALLEGFNQSIGACDLGQLFLLRESGTMVEQDPKIQFFLQISHTMINMICSDKVIRPVCFPNLNDYTNVLLLLPEIRFSHPPVAIQSSSNISPSFKSKQGHQRYMEV